jgi:ssDNA-binding Zn-finger/Zn-ribbon topoisomerase 1
VAESISRGAVAGRLVKMSPTDVKERVHCEECGSDKVLRVSRQGFLRAKIYPMFGYYPWRCSRCGRDVLLRKRRRSKMKENGKEHD